VYGKVINITDNQTHANQRDTMRDHLTSVRMAMRKTKENKTGVLLSGTVLA
jgi:hypothetical protein